jgi:type VI secretion system lysozyme-like protein
MSAVISGHPVAVIPLFERLAQGAAAPPDGAAQGMLPLLQASVARELTLLINTRSGMPQSAPVVRSAYGLPDWTGVYAANPEERMQMERGIENAILAYEPRLANPQVSVALVAQRPDGLVVHIAGRLAGIAAAPAFACTVRMAASGATLQLRQPG